MEYRLGRSQLKDDVVYGPRAPGIPHPIQRADTPIMGLDDSPSADSLFDGRYELGAQIGSGGMSRVHAARDTRTGREIALKILDVPDHQLRWAIERFVRGARIATQVRHTNVVSILDHGASPSGAVYIALERLSGRDLGELLAERRLSWRWTRHMMAEICAGMNAIHEAGFVHCDLKPNNCFFVETSARVEILDFGLATVAARRPPSALLLGTPAYMAPERIRGEALDRRADVYAAGVMLYEMLTGERPFDGEQPTVVFDQHLHTPPPTIDVDATRFPTPPAVNEVIIRALAKRRDDRFADMDALWTALERLEPSTIATGRTRGISQPQSVSLAEAPTLRIHDQA